MSTPPLPAPDHRCDECGFDYAAGSLDDALAGIAAVPAAVRAALTTVPPARRHGRPASGVWSVAEYVCHLRDVFVTSTIRLYRTRTEDRPVLEPMLNDLRAARFRYDERDLVAVLDELDAAVAGVADEAARFAPGDWARTATRLPGEERTASWLIRHARHEGVHHVRDIRLRGIRR
jgi:DinB superfamily